MRTMPARGRLIVILLTGVVLLAVGYSGGLGSPVAQQVQAFLDAGGTPLRNMHKLEPLLRLPLALGLAHLLGRIPLPGSAPRQRMGGRLRPPRTRQAGRGSVVVLVALAAATSLVWTGRLTPPGAFVAIPQYWHGHRRLARRTQCGRSRAGGPRRAFRHPDMGQQPRRALAGTRQQSVGRARLDSADAAGNHPSSRLRAAAVRRGPTVRGAGGYACPPRHFVCSGAQRPRPPKRRGRRGRCWYTGP